MWNCHEPAVGAKYCPAVRVAKWGLTIASTSITKRKVAARTEPPTAWRLVASLPPVMTDGRKCRCVRSIRALTGGHTLQSSAQFRNFRPSSLPPLSHWEKRLAHQRPVTIATAQKSNSHQLHAFQNENTKGEGERGAMRLFHAQSEQQCSHGWGVLRRRGFNQSLIKVTPPTSKPCHSGFEG